MINDEKYQQELEQHERYYDVKKPKREDYETNPAFNYAVWRWSMDKAIDAPNKPDYIVANND